MKKMHNSIFIMYFIPIVSIVLLAIVSLIFIIFKADILVCCIFVGILALLLIALNYILMKKQITTYEDGFLDILESIHSKKCDGEELDISSIKSNVDRICHEIEYLENASIEETSEYTKYIKKWIVQSIKVTNKLDYVIADLADENESQSFTLFNNKNDIIKQIQLLKMYCTNKKYIDNTIDYEGVEIDKIISSSIIRYDNKIKEKSLGLRRNLTKYTINSQPAILCVAIDNALSKIIDNCCEKDFVKINCSKNDDNLLIEISNLSKKTSNCQHQKICEEDFSFTKNMIETLGGFITINTFKNQNIINIQLPMENV